MRTCQKSRPRLAKGCCKGVAEPTRLGHYLRGGPSHWNACQKCSGLAVGISSIKVCAHTMLILERLGAMTMSVSMRKTLNSMYSHT